MNGKRGRFTLIKGFDSIKEAIATIEEKFPNIGTEDFDIVKFKDMYYAVTMQSTYIEIVISKEYTRYRFPKEYGIIKTQDLRPQHWKWDGIHGGDRPWCKDICMDGYKFFKEKEEVVRRGNGIKGNYYKRSWTGNTRVLLFCLFADKTRNDDNATY